MKKRSKIILLLVACLGLLFSLYPGWIKHRMQTEIYTEIESVPGTPVAIVFGAKVLANGQPSDVLNDRLTQAAALYHAGKVKAILVSGDNAFEHYNEPDAMADYLENSLGVPSEKIAIDYAGRRTYDTCMRAHLIWGVDEAILVTQEFHLPRAILTCTKLGIQSHGFSATLQPYIHDDWYSTREWLATYKAFLDLYIWKPSFIGGEKEEDFLELF